MRIKQIGVNVWIKDGWGDVFDEPEYLSFDFETCDVINVCFNIEGRVTLRKIEKACKQIAKNEFDDVSYITMYITLDTDDVYYICIEEDTCELDENKSNTLENTYTIKEFEKLFINNK